MSNAALMARRREQPLEHRLLLTATFCLLAGGAVMVYSASSARTLLEGQGDGTMYLVKYVGYGAVGLVAMHLLSRHGLGAVRKYTPWLLLAFTFLIGCGAAFKPSRAGRRRCRPTGNRRPRPAAPRR